MRKKLCGKRGETLAEALFAILIVALSSAMLVTMISVSTKMTAANQELTAVFYEEVTDIEARHAEISTVGTVRVTDRSGISESIDVTVYQSNGGLVTYEGVRWR